MMRRLVLAFIGALAFGGAAFAAPPPIDAFARLPAVQDAAISPDGQRVVILGGDPRQRTITIARFDSPETHVVGLGNVQAHSVRWAGDRYIIVQLSVWKKLDVRVEGRFYRNVVIDIDGKVVSTLLAHEESASVSTVQSVVGVVEGDRPAAMMRAPFWHTASAARDTRLKKAGDDDAVDEGLWRVDLKTGDGVAIERSHWGDNWGVDKAGEARVKVAFDAKTDRQQIFGRAKGQKAWRLLREGQQDDLNFLGYSDAEDAAYLEVVEPGPGSIIIRQNLATNTTEDVFRRAGADPWLVWDENDDRPVAITTGVSPVERQWLDPEVKAAHAVFVKTFPGKAVELQGWSRDRTRFLARVTAPDAVPQWFLFDRPRKEISPIGDEYPELAKAGLGRTLDITYKARDGLTIPAYLTLPPGAPEKGAKLPLVVYPHGGPAAHDEFDFDWWAQFMASRGYAVLQPQFRGSTGYGAEFERAGHQEWGGKVQTDLLDGIAYLAGQSVVDPGKVCIVGASFGGYSALAGATLHPEAYRCAVSVNGVSDLVELIADETRYMDDDDPDQRYWRRELHQDIGARALLAATSPARHVGPDTVPILLISSDQDTTVYPSQSRLMERALTGAGQSAYVVKLVGDDHYFQQAATRTKLLQSVEEFLARYLGR